MKIFTHSVVMHSVGLICALWLAAANATTAAAADITDNSAGNATGEIIAGGEWTNKGYDIHGKWRIVKANAALTLYFDEDFKTRRGPDLKVFLSPYSLAAVTGKTVTPVAVEIGPLKSPRGAQQYEIPADIELREFRSLLIHCERFSHLWGGAELALPE